MHVKDFEQYGSQYGRGVSRLFEGKQNREGGRGWKGGGGTRKGGGGAAVRGLMGEWAGAEGLAKSLSSMGVSMAGLFPALLKANGKGYVGGRGDGGEWAGPKHVDYH